MTVPARGGRIRRGGRRPGWALLTTLLALAIAASSALVFTSRVELLKLAVIVALWAAAVSAFVSAIYRRQSDADRARARDLKLVYDLQLDREISARREYELTLESQLRRELMSEVRAQAADEVAALRSELSALRNSLGMLFGADLSDRPALENERTTVRAHSDWARYDTGAGSGAPVSPDGPAVRHDDTDGQTAENPIIDVPEVRVPPGEGSAGPPWQPLAETRDGYPQGHRGAPRRGLPHGPRHRSDDGPGSRLIEPTDDHRPSREYPAPADVSTMAGRPGSRPGRHSGEPQAVGPREGIDSGRGHRRSDEQAAARHSAGLARPDAEAASGGRSSVRDGAEMVSKAPRLSRHRGADSGIGTDGPSTGGHSVADLLARIPTAATGDRRRRRREE